MAASTETGLALPGPRDWVQRDASAQRMERIEAFFGGHGYDMHRHDTYAIGHTLAGVQSFAYRRGTTHSTPGGTIVLHPDEPHDGHAGTDAGFHYRMLYIEPALIQRVLGGKPLPFVAGGRSSDPRLFAASGTLLRAMDYTLDPLEEDDAIFELAHALAAAAGAPRGRQAVDYRAAEIARTYLLDNLERTVTLDELEQASGRDRWSLSRDFRVLYGTSPHRYLVMRRLETVRRLVAAGQSLADASAWAGFTDQSHMTRHFTRAFGHPPGRWLRALRGPAG
ncbi:AraC family transcriptional regulator [Cupriavidus pauculus]|uniref:AraC family transcriptional regulator n=1 Tax=Cupriavidus pauculus TaxID=82633 RepID=UPI001EE1E480|nr:AraC family transcriptional regulator [Cupriavidus pauculus]GJG97949.1 helix-turn-helix domain-containing protein [Cupriavidus pauculus]